MLDKDWCGENLGLLRSDYTFSPLGKPLGSVLLDQNEWRVVGKHKERFYHLYRYSDLKDFIDDMESLWIEISDYSEPYYAFHDTWRIYQDKMKARGVGRGFNHHLTEYGLANQWATKGKVWDFNKDTIGDPFPWSTSIGPLIYPAFQLFFTDDDAGHIESKKEPWFFTWYSRTNNWGRKRLVFDKEKLFVVGGGKQLLSGHVPMDPKRGYLYLVSFHIVDPSESRPRWEPYISRWIWKDNFQKEMYLVMNASGELLIGITGEITKVRNRPGEFHADRNSTILYRIVWPDHLIRRGGERVPPDEMKKRYGYSCGDMILIRKLQYRLLEYLLERWRPKRIVLESFADRTIHTDVMKRISQENYRQEMERTEAMELSFFTSMIHQMAFIGGYHVEESRHLAERIMCSSCGRKTVKNDFSSNFFRCTNTSEEFACGREANVAVDRVLNTLNFLIARAHRIPDKKFPRMADEDWVFHEGTIFRDLRIDIDGSITECRSRKSKMDQAIYKGVPIDEISIIDSKAFIDVYQDYMDMRDNMYGDD